MDPYYLWLGVPPEEQPPNHYRLLGVRLFEANRDVLSMAYGRQSAHVSTFQNGPHAALANRLLNEIAAAHAILLRPDWKAVYDQQLTHLLSSASAQLRPMPSQHPQPFPVQYPNPAPVPAPVLAVTTAASDASPASEEEEQADDWDAPADGFASGRRARRARRRNEGNFALVGLVAAVAAGVVGVIVWRSLPAEPAAPPAKSSLALRSDHDVQHHTVRKHEQSSTPKQMRRPLIEQSNGLDSELTTPQFQPSDGGDANFPVNNAATQKADAPGAGMPQSPSAKVAPAFAARLDPRLNPDLASILDGPSVPGQTANADMIAKQPGQASWEDGTPNNPKLAAFDRIDLGSGLFLTMASVDLTPDQIASMVPGDAEIFSRTTRAGVVTGAFSSVRGNLEGPALEMNADSQPAQFGGYENGKRDGAFRLWGQQQKRLLYSQYTAGVKNGITCVFRSGQPRYVEISDKRGTQQEFLIHFSGGRKAKVTAKRDFTADDQAEYAEARARLAVLEAHLTSHENLYKKHFADWLEGANRQKATSPKRANGGPTRDAQNSAIFAGLLRGAASNAGRSTP